MQETYPLTKDGYLKTVEFDDAKVKKFWTRRKMGFVAVALTFAASNVDEIDRWSQFNADGPMVQSFEGCEIDYLPPSEPKKLSVEEPLRETQSVARNFTFSSINIPETIRQGREMESQHLETFTMPQSGIIISLHGPEELSIDHELFAELFHAPLMLDEEYGHKEVRQLVACYREKIIDARAYAGTVYDFYVKDDIGFCIEGLRFQEAIKFDKCDGNESALPKIELEFLNIKLIEKYMFFLSSSSTDPDRASRDITKLLLHGSVHAHGALLDQPLRLDPDERLVDYITAVTTINLYPEGIPLALRYPSQKTVSLDED